jgi:hypothetical protein
MKDQAKLPIIVLVVVAVVALLYFFGSKAFTAGNLDSGQVKYTPGKPPWEETDPSKKGPGASPGAGQTAPPQGQPAPDGRAPAGMGAPDRG